MRLFPSANADLGSGRFNLGIDKCSANYSQRRTLHVKSGHFAPRVGLFLDKFCIPRLHSAARHSTTSSHITAGCIQKFPDWVDNEIYAYNNKHSFGEATQRVMVAKLTTLTHKTATQLHLVAEGFIYHFQFTLQVASPETFR
jgi:hypothetical protein